MKIAEVRQGNLRHLIERFGGPTALAKRLGYTGPSYLSQMANGIRPISEKTVRKIEEQLGLPQWTLDQVPGEPRPFAGTDRSLIAGVIRAVGEELELKKIRPAPAKLAELTTMVYEKAAQQGHIDMAYVRSLIALLS